MAQSLAVNLVENIIHERVGDISILLIDDDNTSNAPLTSMLEKFSYKVMSVKVASEAISMIEKQKDIGLVIANIELPHIDSHSFLSALLQKDIPLILITSEIMTKKASNFLTKATRFCLKKPILENDIKNLWQHVLPKKSQVFEKINIVEKQKSVMTEDVKQIEAFRENLKRQRTSQASLLGSQKFMKTFTTSEMYQKRKSVENAEWKTKLVCPIEIENKGREGKKVEINIGRRRNLWTPERHIKFLASLSILGGKSSRPKSILRIMNDPNLTHRQVASHLQKYKAQIERINETLPRNEWISTEKTFKHSSDYEYPFKASNLTKNLIESNSLWYSLKKKKSSSSSITQFFFKKSSERKEKTPNLHLGGQLDLSTPALFGNILNKSSIEAPSTTTNNPPYNIPSTNDVNHSGLVSTSFSSDKLPDPSGVGASSTHTFPMETTMIRFPNSDPKPMQSSTSVFESDRNPLDIDPISILNSYVPQADQCNMGESYFLPDYTMNLLDTNIDQMGWIPSTEGNSHHETNMNHMDWIPSTENYVHPETDMNIISLESNTNHMGGAFSREGYVPSENMIFSDINQMDGVSSGENHALSQDMIFTETNTTHLGFVSCEIPPKTNMPILETNTNQMDWFFSEESYVLSKNMTSCETNTTQVGLVPCETSYAASNNMIPLETNTGEMGLVPFEEGYDVPIENLISFDIDVNEMDMGVWLENDDTSDRNIHFSTSNLGNDFASNTPIDSISQISTKGQDNPLAMHQREGMNVEDNFDTDREIMDWVDKILSED